jgi:C4-dicarboxylate transporter, DctM subunit
MGGKTIGRTFIGAFWALLMPLNILGGILGGIFTPTEAAVVAVVFGVVIGMLVLMTYIPDTVILLPNLFGD